MVYFLITGRSVSLLTISYLILHVVATPRNREEPKLQLMSVGKIFLQVQAAEPPNQHFALIRQPLLQALEAVGGNFNLKRNT